MKIEQVALPAMRRLNANPRSAAVVDRLLRPYNPFSPALSVDPYPTYRELRAKGPISHHRMLNSWVASSFAVCEEVLRSPTSVDRNELFDAVPPWSRLSIEDRSLFTSTMLLVDPPDHTRLRKLVSRAFTPRTVELIRPRIAEIATELVDRVRRRSEADLFADVFAPLPIYVIGELLGIPEGDWGRLKGWSDELAKFIDPIEAFDPATMSRTIAAFTEALDGWIEMRTAEPGDDLLSQLLAAEADGDRLSRSELRSMVSILMVAGHETTSGLLGNSIMALCDRPDLGDRLAEDPDVVGTAVEELIRFDSPVQNTDRFLLEDLEVAGRRLPAGQMVVLVLGAANRDPEQFDRPDELDFDRPGIRSLSFGHGIHHCLGAALAREEARTVLPLVCRELRDHHVQLRDVRWKRSMTLRGPIRLPVVRR